MGDGDHQWYVRTSKKPGCRRRRRRRRRKSITLKVKERAICV